MGERCFSEKELADRPLAILAINGWNRLAIPLGTPAGSYQPDQFGKVPAKADH